MFSEHNVFPFVGKSRLYVPLPVTSVITCISLGRRHQVVTGVIFVVGVLDGSGWAPEGRLVALMYFLGVEL